MSNSKSTVAQPVEGINNAADTPATPERDANGRFTAGNKIGRGNPFGRQLAGMRQAILRTITEAHVERLMGFLFESAMQGNMAAAKLLLLYVVGKPQAVAQPDRVDVEEWALNKDLCVSNEELRSVMDAVPINVASGSVAFYTPQKEKIFLKSLRGEMPPEPQDVPLTPEELEEMRELKRQWAEEDRAEEAMMAAGAAARANEAGSPSPNGFNGGGSPSLNGFNGGSAAARAAGGQPKTASAAGSRSRQAS